MQIRERVALKEYSTFHIGGEADFFIEVFSKEELREAVLWAKERRLPWYIIGEGSNILFSDEGVRGVVIKNAISNITHEQHEGGILLSAGAGVLLDALVLYACEHEWWGLENLSAIPGTVGATPIQNVGAYGIEVADRITSVSVYDTDADVFTTLSPEECHFGYRHSIFKEVEGKRYVIYAVSFFLAQTQGAVLAYKDLITLQKEEQEKLTPLRVREEVMMVRSKKFPDWHTVGTAGSFFKNPIIVQEAYEALRAQYPEIPAHTLPDGRSKITLGWVLDHVCQVKGLREGNVGTFEAQALVVVAYPNATAQEVLSFTEKIRECVEEKCGIAIEREVRTLS